MKKRLSYKRKVAFQFMMIVLLFVFHVSPVQNEQQKLNFQQVSSQNNGNSQMLPYHVLPIHGNASLGYYYANIYIGSPNPQPQSVIIDTGSGLLAVPCSNCQQCGHKNHINPPYDPTKSQTSHILTCQSPNPICKDKCMFKKKTDNCTFTVSYAEGSTLEGGLVQDDIRLQTIGKNQQIRTSFGCTQKQTKLFFQQKANGIFGLAPKRQSNLLQQMFRQHSLHNGQKKIFSLCLASNGGIMTVGGVNKLLHPHKTEPDISIPFNDANNLYSLNGVRQISIGQMFITSIVDRIGGYGIFIDSGSTFSYIPQAKYNQVQKLLNKTCIDSQRCQIGRGEDSICYRLHLTKQQNLYQQVDKMFPSVQINIQNKRIQWLPTRYMLLRDKNRNEVCMGLQPLNRYLLGANWMLDRDVVFDLNQKIIHIYDNVQCMNNTQIMSQYTNKIQNTSVIQFTKQIKTNWKINTNSTTFILGVVCFILAVAIAVVICCCDNKNSNMVIIKPEQQEQIRGSSNNLKTINRISSNIQIDNQ